MIYPERVTFDSNPKCTNNGGNVISGQCFTPIDPDVATNYNYTGTNVDIYQLKVLSLANIPYYYVTQAVYPASTWPNLQTFKTIAMAVMCNSANSGMSFRMALLRTDIGPCIFDTEFGIQVCSQDGKGTSNSNYQSATGVTLPNTAIIKSMGCP